MKWYSLTGKTKNIDGRNFMQLKYNQNVGSRKSGDIIGWVESETSLKSPCELMNATIYKESVVGDMCKIFNSTIFGSSYVSGKIVINSSKIQNAHFICDRASIKQCSTVKETEICVSDNGKIIFQIDGPNAPNFKLVGSKINKNTNFDVGVSVCGILRIVNTTLDIKKAIKVDAGAELTLNESIVKNPVFLCTKNSVIDIEKSLIDGAVLGNGDIKICESDIYSNVFSHDGYEIFISSSEIAGNSCVKIVGNGTTSTTKKGVFRISHCKIVDNVAINISTKTRTYHYMNDSVLKNDTYVFFENASFIVRSLISDKSKIQNAKINKCTISGRSKVENISVTNSTVSGNAVVGGKFFKERYEENKSANIFSACIKNSFDCSFVMENNNIYASINGKLFYFLEEKARLVPIEDAFEEVKRKLQNMIIVKKQFDILKYDIFDVDKISKKSIDILCEDLSDYDDSFISYIRNMEILGVYNIFFSCALGCFSDKFIPFLDNVFSLCKINIFNKNIEEVRYDKITFLSRFVPNFFLSNRIMAELTMVI